MAAWTPVLKAIEDFVSIAEFRQAQRCAILPVGINPGSYSQLWSLYIQYFCGQDESPNCLSLLFQLLVHF